MALEQRRKPEEPGRNPHSLQTPTKHNINKDNNRSIQGANAAQDVDQQ